MTDGIERAVEMAQHAAGDRAVSVCAANVAQQLLRANLLDEIRLSVAPVLLGGSVRLLEDVGPGGLQQIRVIESTGITQLRYRVTPLTR